MRRSFVLTLALASSALVLGAAWQVNRYAGLAAEARRLEASQESWIEENRKLAAGIAVLASRARAASVAASLGLEKVSPERRLFIVLPKKASGGSDG
jgi:hypothetical protein